MKNIIDEHKPERDHKKAKKVYYTIVTLLAFIGLFSLAAFAPELVSIAALLCGMAFLVWVTYAFVSEMVDNDML
jgi:hypothetical protein